MSLDYKNEDAVIMWQQNKNLKKSVRCAGALQSGFSLVEIMVAAGLLLGLSVALMHISQNQMKVQKTAELKAEISDVENIFRQTIQDLSACEATFIGMSPGDSIPEIRMSRDMSKDPFAEVGKKFKSYNVYIEDITLLTREEELEPIRAGGTPLRKTNEPIITGSDDNWEIGRAHV